MAQEATIEKRLAAGKRFVSALQDLGLITPLAFWVREKESDTFILMIVTDFFDLKGPLELNRLMFSAYNAEALPQDIDPFHVQFCSPHQILGRRLVEIASIRVVASNSQTEDLDVGVLSFDGFETKYGWFIHNKFDPYVASKAGRVPATLAVRKPSDMLLKRQWRSFASRVEKLAA